MLDESIALLTSAGREALASWGGGDVAALAASQLGDITEQVINAQPSQSNELEADG